MLFNKSKSIKNKRNIYIKKSNRRSQVAYGQQKSQYSPKKKKREKFISYFQLELNSSDISLTKRDEVYDFESVVFK